MQLHKPRIERCFIEQYCSPPLPAMELSWGSGTAEQTWHLPDGVSLKSPAPRRFGVTVHRFAADAYRVRVLWNHVCLSWDALNRVQIMASALAPILDALDTDLWYLLNQSIETDDIAQAA